MTSKSRLLFYIYSYGFIVFFAIIGLIINNRTMTLNDRILKLNLSIDALEEQNKLLQLTILQTSSLEHLEQVCAAMNLKPSTQIFYLKATHVQ